MIPDSSTPLYYQIVIDIKEKIENQTYKAGDRIPAEEKLKQIYNVSRNTIRKALDELVTLNLIKKESNKGHFVNQIKMNDKSKVIRSMSDTIRESGHVPSSKVISMKMLPCPQSVLKYFKCQPGTMMIITERIRYSDGKPVALEKIYLPASRFNKLDPWELEENSLMSIIVNKYGIRLGKHIHTLEPIIPSKEQRALLELGNKQPQLLIRNTLEDKEGNVVEHAELIYLTHVLEYSFTWKNE